MKPSITNPIRKYFRPFLINKDQKSEKADVYSEFHRFSAQGYTCDLFNTMIFKVLYSQQHVLTTSVVKKRRMSLDIHEITLVSHKNINDYDHCSDDSIDAARR